MKRPVLGLDIGGANLKAAHTGGTARSVPFALWRDPGGLDAAVERLVGEMPPFGELAVTMTGELCDCFASKREGVNVILDAVVGRAKTVRVWTNDGRFVDSDEARREPYKAASANWLALATFAGRYVPAGPALLLDVGTTTSDIVPLLDGVPVPRGRTDTERLASYELLYRGWRRTPLIALGGRRMAAEVFATMHDACLVLGHVPEDGADRDTADGRPATREDAERRLARMECADLETAASKRLLGMASWYYQRLLRQLSRCVNKVGGRLPQRPEAVVASGSGWFVVSSLYPSVLGSSVWHPRLISLRGKLGDAASAAACAHAVAVLAQEAEA